LQHLWQEATSSPTILGWNKQVTLVWKNTNFGLFRDICLCRWWWLA
jgi:hypothetical protein